MLQNKKAFISTVPFGKVSSKPIDLLKENNVDYIENPYGRKIEPEEVLKFIPHVQYYIAGTEQITKEVLDAAKDLEFIVRVGVGVDNIPFSEVRKRNIHVSYTPDAPTDAVAELCIGLFIDLLRKFSYVNAKLHKGIWDKYTGNLIQGKTVGIIGLGRIGKKIASILQSFGATVLANDIVEDTAFALEHNIQYTTKEEIFREADIISLNLSYSSELKKLINKKYIRMMKKTAFLVNTSRGEIIDENDLHEALKSNAIAGAAIDVYAVEPYNGKLCGFDNVILTAHIGAATVESRLAMELGAVEEVIRFHNGEVLKHEI